ncbi:glycosyltransferase [Clostridium perfringens]|nr:glycosyltransferase [Clostridium perfringens]
MKKILFVIDSLGCGGAEKSLISLLNNIDFSKIKVDILVMKKGGEFEKFLPKKVKILDVPEYFSFLNGEYKIKIYKKFLYEIYRIKTSLKLRANAINKNGIHSEQVVYNSIEKVLPNINKEYDVAIAYNQGFPTYFVAEKVRASKKIAWINCDYIRTKYDKDIDNYFYNKIDRIIVVSDFLYNSISEMKYSYKDKMKIILDIVDANLIKKMASDGNIKEFISVNGFKLLTVGRLVEVKGYDLLLKTAKLLKKNGHKFKWFIIGEGPERKEMENFIKKNNLVSEVVLLGAKSNPYPYMKHCDLYVQTSKKEGFGLTVIEAKILENVIVTTNFDTSKELIKDNFDGFIVEKKEEDIYQVINKILCDKNLYKTIKFNLEKSESYSTIGEINKFYEEII